MFKQRKNLIVWVISICVVFGFLAVYFFNDLLAVREYIEYGRTAEEEFDEVSGEIGRIRGLPHPRGVELEIVTLSWVMENWGWKQVEAASREVEVEERIYKALFLIPENVSLQEVKVQEAGAILAASSGDKVYIVKEYFNPYNKPKAKEIFVHELAHILQGRYFKTPERRSHDERQAWSALTEGDAGLTAKEYGAEADPGDPPVSPQAQKTSSLHLYAFEMPDSLMRIWLFPYQYGQSFVEALYNDGGWMRVNQAYGDPPKTTEQIMHPEKYLEGERYVEVETPPLNASGWNSVKTDRFGEHFILVMLDTHLLEDESMEAAKGWNGDTFTYYEREDDYMFVWKIAWDTEEDAIEFSDAFVNMMSAVGADRLAINLWEARGEYITFERDGLSTLILGSTTMSY